jgi:hypothetical protein
VAADAWSGTSHSRRQTARSRIRPAEMPVAIVSRAGQPPSSDPTNALERSAYATSAEGEKYQRSRVRFRGQGSVGCRWATRSVM